MNTSTPIPPPPLPAPSGAVSATGSGGGTTFRTVPQQEADDARSFFERIGVGRVAPAAVGFLALAALFGDIGLRAGVFTVASFLSALALAAACAQMGVASSRRGLALIGAGMLVAVWLPIRASLTLTALNTLTIIGLFTAAALVHNVAAVKMSLELAGALLLRAFTALLGPFVVLLSIVPNRSAVLEARNSTERVRSTERLRRALPIVRGVLLAIIPLVILGALLASSDAVFASLFDFDVEFTLGPLIEHLFIIGFLGCGLSMVAAGALQTRPEGMVAETRIVGKVEATVVLGLVAGLFSVFTVVQIVTALGGAKHIIETENLTRAEYARTGFFQLLAVAAITLVLVTGLRALARRSSDRVELAMRLASVAVCVLTLGIVFVSLSRLWLYVDAFGLTEMRLLSSSFAVMLGVIFCLLAVSAGLGGQHSWFWWGSFATAIGVLVVLNAVNYEARIVEWNLTSERTAVLGPDTYELRGTSPDAIPTLYALAPDLATYDILCGDRIRSGTEYGPLGYNVGNARADRIIEKAIGSCCADQTSFRSDGEAVIERSDFVDCFS